MKNDYVVIFCVRDSKDSIENVVNSLINQTIPPKEIIVIDDGSTDGTSEILKLFGDKITIHRTQNRTRDYSRLPTLWNMGLENKYSFHMIGAGDVSFENNYAELILHEFEDDMLAIVSGDFEPFTTKTPHGAGRFVRNDFFFKYYEKYNEIMGYESEILYKAMINNYRIKITKAIMYHHEKLGHGHNFEEFGRSMKSLGYSPVYVMIRFFLELIGNNVGRKGAINMLYKYLTYRPEQSGYFSSYPKETRQQIKAYQNYTMINVIRNRIIRLRKKISDSFYIVYFVGMVSAVGIIDRIMIKYFGWNPTDQVQKTP
jgi:glycosyltransferase involved in cell wall biosynthesis